MNFQTIPEIINYNARLFPTEDAVIFEDSRVTCDQLKKRVDQRANALLELGVSHGDHVASVSINSMEYVETMLAVWALGAVNVTINWRLSAEELIYVINQCQAKYLIFQDQFSNTIKEIKASLTHVQKYLVFEGSSFPGVIDFSSMIAKAPETESSATVKNSDIATIIYTSGTTGRPKGVVASHKNWIASCDAVRDAAGDYFEDHPKSLFSGPFFHSGGLMNMLICLYFSSPQVIMKKFTPVDFLNWIENEKINRIQGVASLYNMILQAPKLEQYNLSSVDFIGSGAERMADETRKRFGEIFPGAEIFESYAMTETCASTTFRYREGSYDKNTSVGKPKGDIEVRVADEKGSDLPPGTPGEVLVRGPNIMQGYYNDPEKTSQAIQNGWLYTGDLGQTDEDGFLYILERKNDMIKTGGENIYPKEVENAIYQHPEVVEAAVFGIPDDIWGQKVCAAVVLEKNAEVSEADIIDFCKSHVASFKKPKHVFFIDSLMRTPSGKIQRSALRDQFLNLL
jgi:fatty-acyl-CoA synthase